MWAPPDFDALLEKRQERVLGCRSIQGQRSRGLQVPEEGLIDLHANAEATKEAEDHLILESTVTRDVVVAFGGALGGAFVNFVAGGMDKFLGGEEQDDDITISTLKRMK